MAYHAEDRVGGTAIDPEPTFRCILVPTDFSSTAEQAWAIAKRLGAAVGAELVLLHVLVETPLYSEGPLSGARVREVYKAAAEWAEKEMAGWAEAARAAGFAVRTLVKTGAPHEVIVRAAAELGADLIVLGTHGRGGINRALLGSVADRVVRLAACPVLTVRERPAR